MGNINNPDYNKTGKDKVLNALKLIQLTALEEIDRICKKHDITYSLSGGTCLGAIRDQGIIPWDDDIDVEMMRDQYEKFLSVLPDELDHDRYYLGSHDLMKDYHSVTPKLMIKNTNLRTRFYLRRNLDNPICVDMFIYDYMPNDEVKRRKLTTKIYYTRVVLLFKWLGATPRLPARLKPVLKQILKLVPYSLIHWYHDRLVSKYAKTPTDWILDTAVINGNYGGMPCAERAEHVLVDFEDRKFPVMKGYDIYLRRFFGNSYMKWLPPEKRVSHHKWAECDFGPYIEELGLDIPEDYDKYMVMKLNDERLLHVKKLCLEMLDDIRKILDENGINYFIAGKDALAKAYGIEEEYCRFWRSGMTLAIKEKDYNKVDALMKEQLDSDKYFYQTRETDEDYRYPYPKIRLNNTIFRDNRTFPSDINIGLWVNIALLAKTSSKKAERKKHQKDLIRMNNTVRNKWIFKGVRVFKIKSMKALALRMLMTFRSMDGIYSMQRKVIDRFKNEESGYLIDITGKTIDADGIREEWLDNSVEMNLLGHRYRFPSDLDAYAKAVEDDNKDDMKNLSKIKKTDHDKYMEVAPVLSENDLETICKRVGFFSLGIHDHPDYLLSAFSAVKPGVESATLEDFEQPEFRKF